MEKKLIVFLGAPGSGKGTQAKLLFENYYHLSTGDILRSAIENNTTLGQNVKFFTEKGLLVPDSTMISLIEENLSNNSFTTSIILDGFPRTINQAESLDKLIKVSSTIYFRIAENILIPRLINRKRTGETLDIIEKRLKIYKSETKPLIKYYEKDNRLSILNAEQSIEDIHKDLINVLNIKV